MPSSKFASTLPKMSHAFRVIALLVLLLSNLLPLATPAGVVAANIAATKIDAAHSDVDPAQVPAAANIVATKTDALLVDNDHDGRADPGDTLRYTVVTTNTGTTDAAGLVISDTLDPNTRLVAGSVRVSPLAFPNSYSTLRNTPLTIAAPGLLANDTGTPAPTVTPASKPTSAGGTVTLSANGGFSYTPPSGYTGTDSFSYTVTNLGGSDSATVTLLVRAVPVAVDDSYNAARDTTLNIAAPGLLANDTGFPAPTVTPASGAPTSAGGTVTLNADGSFSYTPPSGYTGPDSFTYTITNAVGSDTATVSLTVGVGPAAVDDSSYVTLINTALNAPAGAGLLLNDTLGTPAATLTSYGGGSLGGTVTSNTAGSTATFGTGGSLTVNADGSFSFTPATGFTGNFTFLYRITNTAGTSDAAVTIAVRQAPTAVADPSYLATTGQALNVPNGASDLLSNDTLGFPAATLTSFGAGTLGGAVTDNVAGSTVTFGTGSLTVNADGSFVFTSDIGFTGNLTFQYRLTNVVGTSDATVTILVRQGPTAVDDPGYVTLINTPLNMPNGAGDLLSNDTLGVPAATLSSFGGGSVGGTVTTNAAGSTATFGTGGSLTVNADGSFSFTPATGFTGNFTFLYRITNTAGTSDAAVTIAVRQAPTAVADPSYLATTGQALNVPNGASDLLSNDTLGFPAAVLTSFGGGTLGGAVTDNAAGATVTLGTGSLTVNADGSFAFTSDTGFSGNFTFQYRLTNVVGTSDATVTIFVRQAPTAVDDVAYGVNVGGTLTILTSAPNDLLDNDTLGVPAATLTSFGGGSMVGTVTTNAAGTGAALAGGTLTVNANGSFTFATPTTSGNFTFLYRITNAVGTSDATVSIQVRQPPTAVDDSGYIVNAGSTLTISTSAPNDLLDNDTLGFPVATIASFGGGSLGGAVTDNAAGAGVTLAGGTLTVNANGSFTFATPTTGGDYTFLYRLSNAGGFSDATVSIQVRQAPTAVDDTVAANSSPGDTYHTPFNTLLSIPNGPNDLLANDTLGNPAATLVNFGAIELAQTGGTFAAPIGTVTTNAAGATATFGTGGSLTVNADGSLAFTPPTGYTGLFRFQYRITNVVGSDDGMVTLAVGQRLTVVDETYPNTVVGNVRIDTSVSSSFKVLSNDTGDSLTVVLGTPNNGNVTLNANGTFIFNPTPGYTGSGGFTYIVSNGFGSATGTLSLTVSGMIWFVDNNAGTNGDGRLGTPFNSLANFVSGAADDPGDNIFLYHLTATNYTGGITLQNNQRLIGQGATATLSAITGLTPPADSPALPATGGTRPVISNSATVITLGQGNTVLGLNVSATGGTGISGASVGALTINNAAVTNTTGVGVSLSGGNSSMAVTFDSVSSSGGANGILLTNNSGSFTDNGGTIDPTTGHGIEVSNTGVGPLNLTLQNSTVTGAPTSFNGVNFDIPTSGSFGTLTVKNNTISNNGSTGLRANIQGTGSIGMIEIASNTFTGNPTGVDLATNGTANVKFDIHNNPTMSGTGTQVNLAANDVVHNSGGGPTMEGYIRNNTITASPTGNIFIALWVVSDGDGNITTDINNNTITNFGDSGIDIESRGGTGDVNARIANNSVSTTATGPLSGMFLRSGNGTAGETSLLCANLISNNINGGAGAVADYYLDRFNPATTLFQIQGLSPASSTPAQAEAFVISTDAGSSAFAETGTYTAATCTTVSFAPLPLLAAGGEGPGAPGAQITQPQLDAVTAAAIERWAAAGLPAEQLAQLRSATVQVADIEAGHLGDTFGTQIQLDRDAAGWGWFVDPTPGGDSEFGDRVAATERRAAAGSPAAGRMDLLTVVMHELGHIIGHDDIPAADAPHALMADELPLGVRRIPAPAEVAPSLSGARAVAPSSVTTTSTSVQANVGTLPAAKRVVVTFDVVISSPVPAGVNQVSNQARITATALAPVLSDDPDAAGAANPTITALDVVKKVYLPLVIQPGAADLAVTSVTLSPNKTSFRAGEPVVVTVVIKNQGTVAAAPFWVDMYLNPSRQPDFNVIWNTTCTLNPCFGIGWPVPGGLAPGASVTLTSAVVPPGYSVWPGYFAAGTTDLYVLADSFNPTGPMVDTNRANNLAHLSGLRVTGPNPALSSSQSIQQRPAQLDAPVGDRP